MSPPQAPVDISERMRAAHAEGSQVPPITSGDAGFDLPRAYAVAQAMHEGRCRVGARPVGRKIGFTNPAMWAQYGVAHPVWGYMYRDTVEYVADGRAVCRLGPFAEPKIEPEIVFRFRSTPPVRSDLAAVLAAVDRIALGFEIVQCHFPGWKFRGPDAVVDNAFHGRLLVGTPVAPDTLGTDALARLASFAVSLSCNGVLRETGHGANVLGNPLAAVAHLTTLLATQPWCPPIAPGDVVTTGTLTPALTVRPGETWRADVEGIGLTGLSVEFVP